jgi:hypothetical protein
LKRIFAALLVLAAAAAAPAPRGARAIRFESLLAHLDACVPEEGFPNGSRRFLLTQQSADRNDGDERLRLWLPPSGSLLSEPLEIDGAARLECAVGCELFDGAWEVEGSGRPRPPAAPVATDFLVQWVPADPAAAPVELAACTVRLDPEHDADGRARRDLAVDLPGTVRGAGRLRFRATRREGPAGDLTALPTLWGPRVRIEQDEEERAPELRRDELVVDLLDPARRGRALDPAPVELGSATTVEIDAHGVAGTPKTEPFARARIGVEAHFETGAGRDLPRGGRAPALTFAGSGRASFELAEAEIRGGARLVLAPGLFEFATPGGPVRPRADVTWRATLDGREFAAGRVAASSSEPPGWGEEVDAPLPPVTAAAQHELTIEVTLGELRAPLDALSTEKTATGTRERRVRWTRPWFGLARPRLVRAQEVVAADATPQAPSVLFVCIETLRADEVGFGAGSRPTTPFLSGLAPRALVFVQATSPAPWTLPSVASYLTGLHPFEHGARSELEDTLPDRCTTLAEAAALHAGARTFAFVTNDLLRREAGFAAGFDTFASFPFANAAAVRRLFLDWQSEAPRRRFFAYLHLFEPHVPLNAPGWMREAYVDPSLRGLPYAEQEQAPKVAMREHGNAALAAEALEFLRGRYRGEVRHADAEIDRLLLELARRGVLQKTVVIVTGDHGEEFGEHGWFGHGSQLFEESIHVPLLVAGPGVPRGRIDAPVESLLSSRIAAAALGLSRFGSARLPPVAWPLDRALLEESVADLPVLCGTEKLIDTRSPGWPQDDAGFIARITPRPGRVLRLGATKTILTRPAGCGDAPPAPGDALEIFDLARDPGERAPTVVEWGEEADRRFRRFGALLADERAAHAALPTQEPAPDTAEILRQLGYLHGGTQGR